MSKSKKSSKKSNKAFRVIATNKMSAELQKAIKAVGIAGFAIANAFESGVDSVKAVISNSTPQFRARALAASEQQYKAGNIAASLLRVDAFKARWDNLSQEQQIEEALKLMAKRAPKKDGDKYLPDSEQPDGYRTEREHKACRASDVSWIRVKERAGIKSDEARKNSRAPRPSTTAETVSPANIPPVDPVKVSPKIDSAMAKAMGKATVKEAANDYFVTAAACLLACVNKNARFVDPAISTAVSALHDALKPFAPKPE